MLQVGNEFGAVEALWSQFEGVMGQESEEGEGKEGTEKAGSEVVDGEEEGREESEGTNRNARRR